MNFFGGLDDLCKRIFPVHRPTRQHGGRAGGVVHVVNLGGNLAYNVCFFVVIFLKSFLTRKLRLTLRKQVF